MEDDRFLSREEFESRVLREAVESLNYIWLLASAYRAPELLAFLEALRVRLGKSPDEVPGQNGRLN